MLWSFKCVIAPGEENSRDYILLANGKAFPFAEHCYHKNHISTIVIGLKNSCFPLIHLLSYYQSVCYQTVQ